MDLSIIYEDRKLLAIYKPSGIHTQAGSHNKANLVSAVSNYLQEQSAYLLNRLDTPVAGIVLFAKDKYSARLLSKAIAKHKFDKRYLAIVFGKPQKLEARLVDQIFFDKRKRHAKIGNAKYSKEAILEYRYLEEISTHKYRFSEFNDTLSLLDIKLITGKKHQIRAQLAKHGLPILFDSRYYRLIPQEGLLFKKLIKIKNDYIKLLAYKLIFNNPLNNGKKLEIVLPESLIKDFKTTDIF